MQYRRICRVVIRLLLGVEFRAGGRGVEVVTADESGEERGQWEQFDNKQLGEEGKQQLSNSQGKWVVCIMSKSKHHHCHWSIVPFSSKMKKEHELAGKTRIHF